MFCWMRRVGGIGRSNRELAFVAARTRGRLHVAQVQMEQAATELEKPMEHLTHVPDNTGAYHALSLDLAQSYVRIGRQDEAVKILEELQDDARFSSAGVADAARATARLHYGAALLHAGRVDEAAPVLEAAAPALAAGRSAEALPKIEVARDAFSGLMGEDSPGVHVMNFYLAQGLLDTGDGARAAALADELDPAQLAAGSPGQGWSTRVDALKGWAQMLNGRPEDGAALLAASVDRMERQGLQDWMVEPFRQALPGEAE
jgi:non-specific serine/threonine protein kinase